MRSGNEKSNRPLKRTQGHLYYLCKFRGRVLQKRKVKKAPVISFCFCDCLRGAIGKRRDDTMATRVCPECDNPVAPVHGPCPSCVFVKFSNCARDPNANLHELREAYKTEFGAYPSGENAENIEFTVRFPFCIRRA